MNLATFFRRPDPAEIARNAAVEALATYRAEQEATRAQMAEQVAAFRADTLRAQNGGMQGAPPAVPGNARSVYARDNPWLWNQYAGGTMGYRPGQLVDIPTLRRFAQCYDILRALINQLKNEVEAVPLRITAKDPKNDTPETRARIAEVEAWFDVDGGLGGAGSTRSKFEKTIIEDLHVLGPAAIYLAPTRAGGVFQALPIDAATIRPVVDAYGFPVEGAEYEQWVLGVRHRGFSRAEMYFEGLYPRNDSPYPDSPVEYLALTVVAALAADNWNRAWLTTGSEPGRGFPLSPDLTPEQAMFWIDLFEAKMSGDIEQRQKFFPYPAGSGVMNNPTRRDHDFQEFMAWLARRCSAIIGVSLASVGFESSQYAVTQENSMEATSSLGVGKVLLYLETFYNYLLRRLGYADLIVAYTTEKTETAAEKADRVVKLTGIPVWTPNRGLQELGEDASPDEGADTLWVPTTYAPMEVAMAPPEPTMPGTAAGTESSGDRSAQSQQRAELGRWERKVLSRLRRGRKASCDFESDTLPAPVRGEVAAALGGAQSAEAVRAVFAAAVESLEDLFPPLYHTSAQGWERQQIAAKWAARRLAAEREA